MDSKEQTAILLAEYASIRQLAYTRISNFYQVLTIGPPIVVLAASHVPVLVTVLVLATGGSLIAFLLWHAVTDVGRAHELLLRLEDELNRRAGSRLLTWEHDLGGRVVANWYPRVRRFLRGKMIEP